MTASASSLLAIAKVPCLLTRFQERFLSTTNNNCLQDPNEFPIQNRAVLANNGQFYSWSNGTGHYAIGMVPGNYTISEYVTPYFASNCVRWAYNVTVTGNTYNNADFADSVAVICSDIMVDVGTGLCVAAVHPMRASRTATMAIIPIRMS